MRNYFSFSKNQAVVLSTVLFVIILGSLYFFIYIPGNQEKLEEQRFRCLQNIEENIHTKVDNSIALLRNLLISNEKNLKQFDTTKLKSYIANYPRQRFILLPLKKINTVKDGKPMPDSMSVINFNHSELSIYLRKGNYQAGLRYTVKQFIEPLLVPNIFDQYVVLKGGKIIYQSFPTGVTAIASDSLKTEKSSFLKGQVKTTHMGGVDYKLFAQQLSLKDSVVTVTGLLSSSNYNFERTKLPQNVVLLLLTFAMGVVLALPWIKLYQMGNQDRLTIMDGISSFAVSMLLMSLIFFAFFKYNKFFQPAITPAQSVKKNLAEKINSRYTAELNNTYNLLKKLDTIRRDQKLNFDLKNLGTTNATKTDSNNFKVDSKYGKTIDSVFKVLDINKVYWVQKNGFEINNWSALYDNSPPGDFSGRAYFKNILSDKSYYLNNRLNKPYYVDQIVSWTNGKFTTVISVPSVNKDAAVAAITFNLKCLNRPVMPKGLFYCIIDAQGKVLYHSDTTKNLNENFIAENSAKQKLNGLITSQGIDFFKADYGGESYDFYARPLQQLPYYVLVFESSSFKNMMDIKIFSFSFYMLIVFFFALIIQLLFIFVLCRKQSFFEKQYFDISWIRPDSRYHHEYNIAVALNCINILLLIVFYNIANFIQLLFILFFSATAVTLFVNILLLYSDTYKRLEPLKYAEKRKGNAALIVIIIVINFVAITMIQWQALLFIAFEIISVFCSWRFAKIAGSLFKKIRSIKHKLHAGWWDFSSSYSLMIFTRLIITSGIPVALFYTTSYNYQERLISRYRHAFFIQDILKKAPTPDDGSLAKLTNIYVDDVWIQPLDLKSSPPKKQSTSYAEARTAHLLNKMSYDVPDRAGVGEFYNNNPGNSLLFNGIFDKGPACTSFLLPSGNYLKLTSFVFNYKLPHIFPLTDYGIIYWLIFLFALLVFWRILHLIIRKLFALNLPEELYWQEIDEVIITHSKLSSLLFIIGSPGSGKLDKIKELISLKQISGKDGKISVLDENDPKAGNVLVVDMIFIPDNLEALKTNCDWTIIAKLALEGDFSLIIVNHFEYDIQSAATNCIKLNFLESLLQKNKAKIFITSTVHPVNFLESLNEKTIASADERKPEHDLERWHVLLGHFKIIIKMLTVSNAAISNDLETWNRVLMKETSRTHFLSKMQDPIVDKLQQLNKKHQRQLDGDSLAFKMQVTSHYFYMYIWQSLTKEEKFLLYDLAEDSLVNSYDDYNLTMLLSKGLIIRENGVLHLFNKGFRNFILTAIGTSEAMLIRKQITDNGNWNKLKTPLMILIVAVLAFLFASQQETYSTIITYLGVLTAALPAVLKFFTTFDSGQKST